MGRWVDGWGSHDSIPCAPTGQQLIVPLFQVAGKSHSGSYLQRGDRSLVSNYRPVSLTSVVSKQMAHVIALYLGEIWDKKGKRKSWPQFSRESQVVTVCQNTADSVDNGDRTRAITTDLSKTSHLVPHDRML
jgi:hypothetical protein